MNKQLFFLKMFLIMLCVLLSVQSNYCVAQNIEKGAHTTTNLSYTTQNTWALIIGISNYENPSIPDLNYADDDAIAFYNFLTSKYGGNIPKQQVQVLIDSAATTANIATQINFLLDPTLVKPNDRVIIYFSGHGACENTTISQNGYLLCYNAPSINNISPFNTGGLIPLRVLNDFIHTFSAKNKCSVILIADACRSGKLFPNEEGKKYTLEQLSAIENNEYRLLSCDKNQVSVEDPILKRGVFSYYLINGLAGLSEKRSKDGNITLRELETYLNESVNNYLSPITQDPIFTGDKNTILNSIDTTYTNEFFAAQASSSTLGLLAAKGFEDAYLNGRNEEDKRIYQRFQQLLAQDKLEQSEFLPTLHYLDSLKGNFQNTTLYKMMQRNVAAELQDAAQTIINRYVSGEDIITQKNKKYFFKAAQYCSIAKDLVGERSIYYNSLHANYLFLTARANFDTIKQKSLSNTTVENSICMLYDAESLMPYAPQIYHTLGLYFANNKSTLQAALYYERKAISLKPNWAYPLSGVGYYYSKNKQFDSALNYYMRSIQCDTSYIEGYNNIGVLYKLSKQYDSAIYFLKKAIFLGDKYINCYINLAEIYKYINKNDSALLYYQKAIRIDPQNAVSYMYYGIYFEDQRQFDSAIYYYNIALKLDSSDVYTLKRVGYIFSNNEQFDSAIYYYKSALKLDTSNAFIYSHLGNLYKMKKQYDIALIYNLKAIQFDSSLFSIYTIIGNLYFKINKYDSSIYYYNKYIKYNSTDADVLAILGYLNERRKLYDHAILNYKTALKFDSTDIFSWRNLGDIYKECRQYDTALFYYKKALKLDSTDKSIYKDLGNLLEEKKQYKDAIYYFKKVLNFDPVDINLYKRLGLCYIYIQMYDSSASYFNKALHFNPIDSSIWYNLTCNYSLQNDYNNVFITLKKTLNNGYMDLSHINEDTDLDNIRALPEFKQLIENYFKPEEIAKYPDLFKQKK